MRGKALIFGCGGFVGPYMERELKQHGYTVCGTDLMQQCPSDFSGAYFPCDLTDAEAVRELIRQVCPDTVINLAAISSVGLSWKIPAQTVKVNVCGTLNILEAVRELAPECRILLIGSSEEYVPSSEPLSEDQPIQANNPYGISKSAMEQFCGVYRHVYGMKIYSVRAFNHTGIGQKDTFVLPGWCRQAAEISASGKPGCMKVGNIHVRRDFSDVRDIVRAYRMVLEQGDCEKIYNVGSGEALELRELLEMICSFSKQPITVETDPDRMRALDNPVICCDNTAIRRDLSWEPAYSIKETLKAMFDEFTKQMEAG